ncbi:hypothetical protein C0J52_13063, partial [Blattella germanica]
EVPSILLPCTICNRTFKPESLEKHAKVCEKNAAKKRKTFDSSKQRIQGTELAEYLPVVPKKVEKSPVKKPQSQWKEKHLEFVRAIRQARGVQSPGRRSLSAIEQSRPVNHEQCPHCERNFGPKAFDRHIEWCKEQKSRIPTPLSKSKRSIMREKYSPTARTGIREPSPMGSRGAVNCSTVSISSSSSNQTVKTIAARTTGSAPSSQRSSARESVSSPSCSLQRNVTPRSSTQRRSSSPTKRPSLVKDSAGGRGQTSTPAQKKKATQEGLENLFSSSCNITRLNPSKTNSKQVPVGNAARNKNKKNEVKSTSITTEEAYDPYLSAERQMLELLSGDWPAATEIKNEQEQKEERIEKPEPSPPSSPPNELRTSPTSAFTKYSPTKPRPDRLDLQPASFDLEDLIISGHSPSPFNNENSNLTNNRELMLSLASLCSIPNFDLNLELDMSSVNRKSNRARYRKKLENAALSLQQSVSLYHPGIPMDDTLEEVDDTVNDLQASEVTDVFSSPLHPVSLLSLSSCETKPASATSFHDTEDVDHQPVRPESRKKLNHISKIPIEDEHDGQINRRSITSKVSGDSAYSSLNRKSPLADVQSERLDTDLHCLSSSGSESSLPPLCSVQVEGKSPTPLLESNAPKMSKFCHECGFKYPLTLAKFCCENNNIEVERLEVHIFIYVNVYEFINIILCMNVIISENLLLCLEKYFKLILNKYQRIRMIMHLKLRQDGSNHSISNKTDFRYTYFLLTNKEYENTCFNSLSMMNVEETSFLRFDNEVNY